MNDIDFLALVDCIKEGFLFCLNSSLFWLFVSGFILYSTIKCLPPIPGKDYKPSSKSKTINEEDS